MALLIAVSMTVSIAVRIAVSITLSITLSTTLTIALSIALTIALTIALPIAQAIREARHTPENEMKMGTAYVWQTSVVDGHTQPPSRSPSNTQGCASWPVEEVYHGGLGASLFDLEAYADSVIDLEAYADSL